MRKNTSDTRKTFKNNEKYDKILGFCAFLQICINFKFFSEKYLTIYIYIYNDM